MHACEMYGAHRISAPKARFFHGFETTSAEAEASGTVSTTILWELDPKSTSPKIPLSLVPKP